MLIREAHDLAKEAKMQGQLGVQATAIKLAGDMQAKKVTMLQDVGLLENNELASQISDTERKQEILVKILKEVSASCPKCKIEVSKRLSQINGVAEPIEIVDQVPNE
jgi:acetylglutamate kinase